MPEAQRRIRVRARAASLWLLMLLSAAPAQAGSSAAGTVEALHETFIGVMQRADELGFQGRR